jgi:hypothetical protein
MNFLPDISFLWMNAIGAIGLVVLALLLQQVKGISRRDEPQESKMESGKTQLV